MKDAINNKKFLEELIAYIRFTTYLVSDTKRTTQKTLGPSFEFNVTWRLKAGVVEPQETTVARQRLGKGGKLLGY
jgi:hypothetical protein